MEYNEISHVEIFLFFKSHRQESQWGLDDDVLPCPLHGKGSGMGVTGWPHALDEQNLANCGEWAD